MPDTDRFDAKNLFPAAPGYFIIDSCLRNTSKGWSRKTLKK